MGKLSVDEWNKLDEAAKVAEAENMPDELREKPDDDEGAGKEKEPTAAELRQQLADLNKRIADMENSHKSEVSGLRFDLSQERRTRQQLEQQISEKRKDDEDSDPFRDRSDDDFVSVKDMKIILNQQQTKHNKERQDFLKSKMDESMDIDEERMNKLTAPDEDGKQPDGYPITFAEAFKSFQAMAERDKSLWEDVFREALRRGGKPAEKVYKIALSQDANLSKVVAQKTREKIIKEINEKPKGPKNLGGGGGGGSGNLDLNKLSGKELLEAIEKNPDAVDSALRGR